MQCAYTLALLLLLTINSLNGERFASFDSDFSTAEKTSSCQNSSSGLIYEKEPSTFILGCVSVDSGTLCLSDTDIPSRSPHSLPLIRFYSGGFNAHEFGAGFRANFPTRISLPQECDHHHHLRVESLGGSRITFTGQMKGKNLVEFALDEKSVKHRMTNTGFGEIGGTTNLKNKRIKIDPTLSWKELIKTPIEAYDGSGLKQWLEPGKGSSVGAWVYFLSRELLSSGLERKYTYFKDCGWERVEQKNKLGTPIQWIAYDPTVVGRECRYYSSNGLSAEYYFDKNIEKHSGIPHLSKVVAPESPDVEYGYEPIDKAKRHWRLKSINHPDGRFLKMKYDKDNHIRRIMAPAKGTSEPVEVYNLRYIEHKRAHYRTDVTDAYNNQTIYHFNKQHRLTQIDRINGTMQFIRQELFFWGDLDSPDVSLLVARAIKEGIDNTKSAWCLKYDANGNVLRETLYGNLSGKGGDHLVLRSNGTPKSATESFSKSYRYSDDGRNLKIWEKEDAGAEIFYGYEANSNLLISKLTAYDNSIQLRSFYEYDINGSRITAIEDDGSSNYAEILSGVTHRTIIRYKNQNDPNLPGFGLPLTERSLYLDIESGKEKLLREVRYTYVIGDHIATEEVYDGEGSLAFSRSFKYNSKGKLIEESDALGIVSKYEYDANLNRIRSEKIGSGFHTTYTYDYSNRLTDETEIHKSGELFTKHYSYDLMSRLIEERDALGNTTRFEYDGLGRRTKVIHPAVISQSNCKLVCEESFSYDYLDNEISHTDRCGHTTQTQRNIRGQPTKVVHPDGTVELYEYNLNGTLKKRTHKNGTSTLYSYNAIKKPVRERVVGADGSLISEKRFKYKGDLLILEVDPIGSSHRIKYDGAGRKSEEWTRDASGTLMGRTTFSLDTLGRVSEERTWCNAKGTKWSSGHTAYDVLDRPIRTWGEDESGVRSSEQAFSYNILGKCVSRSVFDDSGAPLEHKTLYNSRGMLILEVDPMGGETSHTYCYSVKDASGGYALKHQKVEANGRTTTLQQDTWGRVSSIEIRNKRGVKISAQKIHYDAEGRKIELSVEKIVNGKTSETIVTRWNYGPGGRLEQLIEAVGSPLERTTTYSYNMFGEQAAISKPNGVALNHEYDGEGRLARLYSSDSSVDYTYLFDSMGRVVEVIDGVSGQINLRTYDGVGRVVSETLGTALLSSSTYDIGGRRLSLQLPDGSKIGYSYNGDRLKKVTRFDSSQHSIYSQEYRYNSRGFVSEATLPFGEGSATYSYDKKGRLTNSSHPLAQEKLLSYDSVGNLIGYQIKGRLAAPDVAYQYDDLDQLTNEIADYKQVFTYDSMYNRISKDGAPQKLNALNELEHDGFRSYRYDLNGNLTEIASDDGSAVIRLGYDALDRLISVDSPEGSWQYGYDSLHRRLTKQDSLGYVTCYIYDDKLEIGSIARGSALISELRVLGVGRGAEIGAAIAIEIEGTPYAAFSNFRGDLTALTDAEGKLVDSYRYTAFGEEAVSIHTGGHLSSWRFSSKRYDAETGFIYFGRRYYNPETGRWITTDPKSYSEGPNLYAYVCNRPLTLCDLFGLAAQTTTARDRFANDRLITRDRSQQHVGFLRSGFKIERSNADDDLKNQFIKYGRVFTTSIGEGFLHPKRRITAGFGIGTNLDATQEGGENISKSHNGARVDVTTDLTRGFIPDLISCIYLFFGGKTSAVKEQIRSWRALISELGGVNGGGSILHYAHSRGCLISLAALKHLSPAERNMIEMVALAPPIPINKKYCKTIVNVANKLDIVPAIGRYNMIGRKDQYNYVYTDLPRGKQSEHDMLGEGYGGFIKNHASKYIEKLQ